MRIEIRSNGVLLDGYVNAVGRDSRPIPSVQGKFIEQIEPRTFEKALSRVDDVPMFLNHDKSKKLASIKDGTLELFEDNIGLRAICTVTDPDIVNKARKKQLVGWSFGFLINEDTWEDSHLEGIKRRRISDLELTEVSIVDNTQKPAYVGTSVEERADKEVLTETRCENNKITFEEIENRTEKIDYSRYENEIEALKGNR